MKKIMNGLLVLMISISLVACGSEKPAEGDNTSKKEFDAYIEKLPTKVLDDTDSALNFLYIDKIKAGFKEKTYENSIPTLKEFEKTSEEMEKVEKKLKSFKRSALSKEQQLTYDVLVDAFSSASELSLEEEYYFTTNYLDAAYGYPSNVPTNFYGFKLRTKEDVESYLHLMETTPSFFENLMKHEMKRQEKGYGMQPVHIKEVLRIAQEFIDNDHSYLIDTFAEKLAKVEGLSDSEKQAYIAKNDTLVKKDLNEAYEGLIKGLTDLKSKSKDEGYAQYKNGDTYYQELVADYAGFDDMEEYEKFLEEKVETKFDEVLAMMEKDPELGTMDLSTIVYTDATSANDTLKELEEKTKEDFPTLRSLNYDMVSVPKSMEGIVSFAAAYFISAVDEPNSLEHMVLKGDYKQDTFTTIAHEGYPGHMYQTQFFKDQNQPAIRQIVDYSGYTEGYANYVEHFAVKYSKNPDQAKMYSVFEEWQYANILLLDLKVHYEGLNKKEALAYITKAFNGMMNEEGAEEIYNQLIQTPALFVKYYAAGFRIADIKAKVQKKMGSDFSDMAFHEALLKVGPAPFNVIEDYIYDTFKIEK